MVPRILIINSGPLTDFLNLTSIKTQRLEAQVHLQYKHTRYIFKSFSDPSIEPCRKKALEWKN